MLSRLCQSQVCFARESQALQSVGECATLLGLEVPASDSGMNQAFDAAVQYVHLNLLQDLSPPWIEHAFSQAVPGDGVLSRYLKPCFLRWGTASARQLFGDPIAETLAHFARKLDTTVVSIVGRPLYVCTQPWKEGTCVRVATASPLMEYRFEHQPFMCSWCKKNDAILPASGSSPRRIIRLYTQMRVREGR